MPEPHSTDEMIQLLNTYINMAPEKAVLLGDGIKLPGGRTLTGPYHTLLWIDEANPKILSIFSKSQDMIKTYNMSDENHQHTYYYNPEEKLFDNPNRSNLITNYQNKFKQLIDTANSPIDLNFLNFADNKYIQMIQIPIIGTKTKTKTKEFLKLENFKLFLNEDDQYKFLAHGFVYHVTNNLVLNTKYNHYAILQKKELLYLYCDNTIHKDPWKIKNITLSQEIENGITIQLDNDNNNSLYFYYVTLSKNRKVKKNVPVIAVEREMMQPTTGGKKTRRVRKHRSKRTKVFLKNRKFKLSKRRRVKTRRNSIK